MSGGVLVAPAEDLLHASPVVLNAGTRQLAMALGRHDKDMACDGVGQGDRAQCVHVRGLQGLYVPSGAPRASTRPCNAPFSERKSGQLPRTWLRDML